MRIGSQRHHKVVINGLFVCTLAVLSSSSFAIDKWDRAVCDAHEDPAEKARCFKELERLASPASAKTVSREKTQSQQNTAPSSSGVDWIFLSVLALIIWFVAKLHGFVFGGNSKSDGDNVYEAAIDSWLGEKRKFIKTNRDAAPEWYWDKITPAQKNKLNTLGITDIPTKKGEASDIIGLFYLPSDDEIDALEDIGIDCEEMSQSEARYNIMLSEHEDRK